MSDEHVAVGSMILVSLAGIIVTVGLAWRTRRSLPVRRGRRDGLVGLIVAGLLGKKARP